MNTYLSDFRPLTVTCVSQEDMPNLLTVLERQLFAIHILNGQNVRDVSSFCTQAEIDDLWNPYRYYWRHDVASAPPVEEFSYEPNLDGFREILAHQLAEQGNHRVAILWTHVENMTRANMQDFLEIALALQFLPSTFAISLHGSDRRNHRVYVETFLLGQDVGFPSFIGPNTVLHWAGE